MRWDAPAARMIAARPAPMDGMLTTVYNLTLAMDSRVSSRQRGKPSMYRWLLSAVAAVVVATPCAPAPAAVQQPSVLTLKVGVALTPAPALPESALWLARDLGFYQKEGLDVQLTEVDATPSVITAMRTGDVIVGDITFEEVIRRTSSGDLPMRAINSASGRNFFMIVGKSSIGSVAELAGKSFAIARVGSQDHALSSKVLESKGVGASSVN